MLYKLRRAMKATSGTLDRVVEVYESFVGRNESESCTLARALVLDRLSGR